MAGSIYGPWWYLKTKGELHSCIVCNDIERLERDGEHNILCVQGALTVLNDVPEVHRKTTPSLN